MTRISAQVSLYPLRQKRLAPAIDEALAAFHHHGLEVFPGTMSTQLVGDREPVFLALKEGFEKACRRGGVVMVVTLSNACPGLPTASPACGFPFADGQPTPVGS